MAAVMVDLCVNVTGPRGAQIVSQTYSGCACEGVFQGD